MDISKLSPSRILSKTEGNEPFYANRMPSVHVRALPFKGTYNYHQASFWIDDIFLSMATRWPNMAHGITVGQQTMVSLAMGDPPDLTVNGRKVTVPAITIGAHNSEYWTAEAAPWQSVIAIFPANMATRGWPQPTTLHLVVPVDREALASIRRVITDLFSAASWSPDVFKSRASVLTMKESLYFAYDDAFHAGNHEILRNTFKYMGIMKRLDDYVNDNLGKTIYSEDISREMNVTARTLNNVTQAVMGLSFHQYLRLKRLWSVRWTLLAGDPKPMIKSVALDHGFWHLGRFSIDYRQMFGESPSDTLKRR